MKVLPRAFVRPKVFYLFLVVLCNTVVYSIVCTNSLQCQDESPETIDFCGVPYHTCINIARPEERNETFVQRSLSSLLDETNQTPLSVLEKRAIVSAAARFMAEINPHRFLQLNLLNVDIVKELHQFLSSTGNETNVAFHMKMASIFRMMDDRHTAYIPPPPLQLSFATLLFNVKDFFVTGDVNQEGKPRRRYVVADVAAGHKFQNPAFGKGAEILKWNGEDIDAFVLKLGRDSYGSNLAAQISNAIQLLSIRFLRFDPIPFEQFTEIQFRDAHGFVRTTRVPWIFFVSKDLGLMADMRQSVPFSWKSKEPNRERKQEKTRNERRYESLDNQGIPNGLPVRVAGTNRTKVEVQFDCSFAAEIVSTNAGPIGHLTLPSFGSNATAELISEMSRILRLMPQNGLVVDIRYNVGGFPDYVKAVSELISDKEIANQPVSLRASNLMLAFARGRNRTLDSCPNAVETAQKVGEPVTGPVGDLFGTLFDTAPGRKAQVYSGPVVTVANGLTYSAGDLFAAVQVDNNVSLLIGTSDNVGAGGASTTTYSFLAGDFPRVLRPLPGGVDFTTSFFRYYRTGAKSGAIVENFGIKPQKRYYPTLNDAVNDDCDLFEFLGSTLASMG